ncbi:MAG: cbb3-type cytochrome c oxidase subunit I [Planctomycetes bacterium]|nr:cbb3-type cytochrome c oxidase subunit I [Planctomycetota bacterium]
MTRADDRLVLVQVRMAIACYAIAIVGGMIAAWHYLPDVSQRLAGSGMALQRLRPIHTTFASLWIYGAAIAVMYHYLVHRGDGLRPADRTRFWFHTGCWILAGVGCVVSLGAGISSGREYLGFHPACSLLFFVGWIALAINFLRRLRNGFWGQPIYVWFWTVGILFFMVTFAEGHAYLLPWVEQSPVRDLQIQWKSCGTLVGSFNFLVYGSLIYVAERLTGDKTYGQSRIAFALFGVGCLNSFTNYAHHTYHLPQSETVKWIAFVVSMLEIVILFRVASDLFAAVRASKRAPCMTSAYLGSAKWWTGAILLSSLLISVPSLNAYIHGTHVVTGHAMGAEIGIDTMALFGGVCFLLTELRGESARARLHCGRMRWHLGIMNASLVTLFGWLTISGTVRGIYRINGEALPDWVGYGAWVFPLAGFVLGATLLYQLVRWAPLLGPQSQESALVDAPDTAAAE